MEVNSLCCGCGVCEKICPTNAISMKEDAFGFLSPVIDTETCIDCGLCHKRCPLSAKSAKSSFTPQYFAAVSTDIPSLKRSASGGAFYVFARRVIERGGVVFGCVLDTQLMPVIRHTDTIDGLQPMQGSKYAEADVADSFEKAKRFLEEGRPVLYAGTPCQLAALRAYLNKEYDLLYCCEIICHGVASRPLLREYIQYLSQKWRARITDITFRDKKKGWGLLLKITYEKRGTPRAQYLSDSESSYYYYYVGNAIYRDSCYQCPYAGSERYSDLTIGDFWGGRRLIPSVDPDLGLSAIVVSSVKGQQLFEECRDSFICTTSDLDTMAKENPNLVRPTQRGAEADTFWKVYQTGGFAAVEKHHKRCHRKSILKGKLKRWMPYAILRFIRQLRT